LQKGKPKRKGGKKSDREVIWNGGRSCYWCKRINVTKNATSTCSAGLRGEKKSVTGRGTVTKQVFPRSAPGKILDGSVNPRSDRWKRGERLISRGQLAGKVRKLRAHRGGTSSHRIRSGCSREDKKQNWPADELVPRCQANETDVVGGKNVTTDG